LLRRTRPGESGCCRRAGLCPSISTHAKVMDELSWKALNRPARANLDKSVAV
jgi:hypothetical protein